MRTFSSVAELQEAAGQVLGSSRWLLVEQTRVDKFAEATDDRQWIHVDPERAAGGPFGATIAHGYLTLSLLPRFAAEIFAVEGTTTTINYGLNRVRFIQPVRVGSWLRSTVTLTTVTLVPGGAQLMFSHQVDVTENPGLAADTGLTGHPTGLTGHKTGLAVHETAAAKPAGIAETISRVLF